MSGYTSEQRLRYAEMLSDLVNEWIVRRESHFAIDLQRGVEWCPDAATGDRHPRPNSTFTLVLRINGGAEETSGPPIVASPALFRPPTALDDKQL